jgi:hypothetical protein
MLGAVIVLDFPGREHQGYLAVGEIKVGILQRFFFCRPS